MRQLTVAARSSRALRTFVLSVAVLWTAAVGSSLLWGAAAIRENAFERAQLQVRLGSAGEHRPRRGGAAAGEIGGGHGAGTTGPAGLASTREARALEAAVVRYDRLMTAGHLALWLTGLGFIAVGGRWLLRIDREREAAERLVIRERETLRLLHDNSPDAVTVIDRGRRILYANRMAERSAVGAPETLHGRVCHEAMHGESSPCGGCPLEWVFLAGGPAGRVRRAAPADGNESWLWQQWYPVRGAGGEVESVVEISRDVSDLKRAEAELGRYAASLAEANRLKDLFTDIMSHDLLNPAAASRYYLERLAEEEVDPRRLHLIGTIGRCLHNLVEMIQNASLYSKLKETGDGCARVMDLGEVVRSVLADLEHRLAAAGMSVAGPAPGSYPARVHPMFANVVSNLVGNAVKYAASGRRVAIDIAGGGSDWVLSVQDWGAGIAASGKGSLFTRFERLGKEGVQGTGLGLAIARRIVELEGGSIWIEDNPEGGSIFRVRVHKGAADEEPAVAPRRPACAVAAAISPDRAGSRPGAPS